MGEYIQIGVTALRDPMTGDFLKSVPLYIREEDSAQAAPLDDFPVAKIFAEKFKQYKAECRKKGIKV
jgi:hypothetical protein